MLSVVFALVQLASAADQVVIGPGRNVTLTWETNVASQIVQICVSASNITDDKTYIALGFTNASGKLEQMLDADIVAGCELFSKAQLLYSNKSIGFPIGESNIQISSYSFSRNPRTLVGTLCFTRAFETGHHNISRTNFPRVIWAAGPLTTDGTSIYYHGSDPADPTGRTQKNRSQYTPLINWFSAKATQRS